MIYFLKYKAFYVNFLFILIYLYLIIHNIFIKLSENFFHKIFNNKNNYFVLFNNFYAMIYEKSENFNTKYLINKYKQKIPFFFKFQYFY